MPLPERPMSMTASLLRDLKIDARAARGCSPKYLSTPSTLTTTSPSCGHQRSPRAMRRSRRSWKNEKTIVSTQ